MLTLDPLSLTSRLPSPASLPSVCSSEHVLELERDLASPSHLQTSTNLLYIIWRMLRGCCHWLQSWPYATSHSSWLLGTAARPWQSLIHLLMQSQLSADPRLIMHNKEQGEKTELLFLFLWLKVSHKLYIPSKTSESFEYQITLHEMKHSMLWLLKNWWMLSENVLFYKCRILFLKLTLKCPVGHQTHLNF